MDIVLWITCGEKKKGAWLYGVQRMCAKMTAAFHGTSQAATKYCCKYTTWMDLQKHAVKDYSHSFWTHRSGAVWKSRWPPWAPVPNKPTVSVDVKQYSTNQFWTPSPPYPLPPHSPSLISFMVSVDVKHHVYSEPHATGVHLLKSRE